MGIQRNLVGYLGGVPLAQSVLAVGAGGSASSLGVGPGIGRNLGPTA